MHYIDTEELITIRKSVHLEVQGSFVSAIPDPRCPNNVIISFADNGSPKQRIIFKKVDLETSMLSECKIKPLTLNISATMQLSSSLHSVTKKPLLFASILSQMSLTIQAYSFR